MASKPEEKSSNAAFGGALKKFAAKSSALGGLVRTTAQVKSRLTWTQETSFNVFVPSAQSPVRRAR